MRTNVLIELVVDLPSDREVIEALGRWSDDHVSALLRKLDQRDRTGLALALYRTLREGSPGPG